MKHSTLQIFLIWMLTTHQLLKGVSAGGVSEWHNGEETRLSPSSLSVSWQHEDLPPQSEEEILVFENQQSLLDEKNQFKRNSLQEGSSRPSERQPGSLHGNPLSSGLLQGFQTPHKAPLIPPSCGSCSLERNACQIVSGIFTRPTLPYGYSLVTQIPVGVCNVSVLEIKPSKNYFALRQQNSNYVLNGNWDLQAAGRYMLGGTVFHYSPSDGSRGEKLDAPGPLLEPLDLMIIYQSKNPGIKYEYRIPIADFQQHTRHLLPNLGSPSQPHSIGGSQNNNGFPPLVPGRPHGTSNRLPISQLNPNARSTFGISQTIQGHNLNQGPLDIGAVPPSWNSFSPIGPFGQTSSAQGVKNDLSAQQSSSRSGKTSFNDQEIRLPEVLNTEPRSVVSGTIKDQLEIPPHKAYNYANVKSSPSGSVSHRTRHNHRQYQPGIPVGRPLGTSPHFNKEDTSSFIERKKKKKFHAKSNRRTKNGKRKGNRRKNRFVWVFKGLSECSQSCGGGEQKSLFSCERKRKGKIVSDKFCQDVSPPEVKTLSCNLSPCPAKWVSEEWGPCSVTCGVGVQTREVSCKQQVSQTLIMMVPAGACVSPINQTISKECIKEDCPLSEPHWQVEEWSKCSAECGIGYQTRNVSCFYQGSVVEDGKCSLEGNTKPESEESCNMGTCITENTWFFSSWTPKCTDSCENGIKSRTVVCIQSEFDYDDSCQISDRPEQVKTCSEKSTCKGQWFAGPWTDCSVTCGTGFETRTVKCLNMNDGQWTIGPESFCPATTRPLESRECFQIACDPKWFTSDWTPCTGTCEIGIQERQVKCLDSHLEESVLCSDGTKPSSVQNCSLSNRCSIENSSDILSQDSTSNSDKEDKALKIESFRSKDSQHLNDPEITNNTLLVIPDLTSDDDKDKKRNDSYGENERTNELQIIEKSGSEINSIPDKDAQGDQSITNSNEARNPNSIQKKKSSTKKNTKKKSKKIVPGPSLTKEMNLHSCVDRIKNCHLVFRARLCRLKYYNKLCCVTCKSQS